MSDVEVVKDVLKNASGGPWWEVYVDDELSRSDVESLSAFYDGLISHYVGSFWDANDRGDMRERGVAKLYIDQIVEQREREMPRHVKAAKKKIYERPDGEEKVEHRDPEESYKAGLEEGKKLALRDHTQRGRDTRAANLEDMDVKRNGLIFEMAKSCRSKSNYRKINGYNLSAIASSIGKDLRQTYVDRYGTPDKYTVDLTLAKRTISNMLGSNRDKWGGNDWPEPE